MQFIAMMLMLMRVKCACRGSANEENEQQFWGKIWNHRWELLMGITFENWSWQLLLLTQSSDSGRVQWATLLGTD